MCRPAPTDHVPIDRPTCYAHILHNTGIAEPAALRTMITAWRELFDSVRPELVVFEHSPAALLAMRGYQTKRLVLGTGFFRPRSGTPLAPLRPMDDAQRNEAISDESRVVETINGVLREFDIPQLDQLGDIYDQADGAALGTYGEFDHFGERDDVDYLGPPDPPAGKPPQWPDYPGPRIFAYLKPFTGMEQLFAALFELGWPTLISSDGIPQDIRDHFTGPSMRFTAEHMDIEQVGRACDLAILNGNHGASCDLLRLGVPILQIPLTVEQLLFARRTDAIGVSLTLPHMRTDDAMPMLEQMIGDPSFRAAAGRFAANHEHDSPHEQRVAEYLDAFLRTHGLP
ncbi:MAG: hypothetical protein GC159_14110 [Phycisphaera sp.]|nr:hypothetical protein [Phycisphaera sp.]